MVSLKKSYPVKQLCDWSEEVMHRVAQTDAFRHARQIALYNALPDEVQTASFLEKWYKKKELWLPVVIGDELELVQYRGKAQLRKGAFGILEPADQSAPFTGSAIDLMLVPGVAFDRNGNRLGRGRGFYDRLLHQLTALKFGICFDFQLIPEVPVESFDIGMDAVITEKEVIGVK